MGPELVEIIAEGSESRGIELVQATSAGRAVCDELRLLENAKVLRDCGPAHCEAARQVADGKRSVDEAEKDRPASGFSEGVELRILVSHHLR